MGKKSKCKTLRNIIFLTMGIATSQNVFAVNACEAILCLNPSGATQPSCMSARNYFFSLKAVQTAATIALRTTYLYTCQPTNGQSGGNHLALIPAIIAKYGALEVDPKT